MKETRRLAAIMFTAIVGSIALMGREEMLAQVHEQNRKIQGILIKEQNRQWLKEIGDGILASFQSITDALNCAVQIMGLMAKDKHEFFKAKHFNVQR